MSAAARPAKTGGSLHRELGHRGPALRPPRAGRPRATAKDRYLGLAEDQAERASIARYEETIHMWETTAGRRPSP